MKKRIAVSAIALVLSGCQLDSSVELLTTEVSEETTVASSDIEATTEETAEDTTEDIGVIEITESETSAGNTFATTENPIFINDDVVEAEELPTNEDGYWLEYGLVNLGEYKDEWTPSFDDEFGPMGVTMTINPLFFIGHDDPEVRDPINEKIIENARMNYWRRFQMRDLKLDIKCRISNLMSRFVSYHFEGMIYHIGGDTKYQDEKEYLYYMTIDRFTGDALSVDTVYGLDKVVEDIQNGNYVPIRAMDGVIEKFGNDLLADIYKNQPLFDDDIAHRRDYYLDDEKRLNVVIWVGDDNGSYLTLCLLGDVKLIDEMDKSFSKDTTAEGEESSVEETTIEETTIEEVVN